MTGRTVWTIGVIGSVEAVVGLGQRLDSSSEVGPSCLESSFKIEQVPRGHLDFGKRSATGLL